MKKSKEVLLISSAFFLIAVIAVFIVVGDISPDGESDLFVVPRNATSTEAVADKLDSNSFISNKWFFEVFTSVAGMKIEPGGYSLPKNASFFKIVKAFYSPPALVWISIPEGLRKEEIAEIVGSKLKWSEKEKRNFITAHTGGKYAEGVYFPDTYLVPRDETGAEMAERMISNFNKNFKLYAEKFRKENIKWTTGLKIASLVQREAYDAEEMPLISGIIWNRLLNDMRLQVDATIQYARSLKNNTEESADDIRIGKSNWWKPISEGDKKIDSLYNTYKYKGLPPTPISNPSISAIEAALHPKETNCIYYIHSADNQVHCTEHYGKHLDNIEMYLR